MALRTAPSADARPQPALTSAAPSTPPMSKEEAQRKLLTQLEESLKGDDNAAMCQALEGLFQQVMAAMPGGQQQLDGAPAPTSLKGRLQDALEKGTHGSAGLVKWMEANPRKALVILAGLVFGVLPVSIALAPLVSAASTAALVPLLGETAASIVGVGAGGALASGTRSLYANGIPMHVLHLDEKNNKQLATDVGMSTGFGLLGFAQAQALTSLVGALGGPPLLVVIALNLVGLVGYEVAKDFVQNAIRNHVANDPKKLRDIAGSTVKLELWSNGIRAVPGLEKSYLVKVLIDILSTFSWNRIVNKKNGPIPANAKQELEAFRFDLNMRISDLYDDITALELKSRTAEEDAELQQLSELRRFYMKEVRPQAEKLWWEIVG